MRTTALLLLATALSACTARRSAVGDGPPLDGGVSRVDAPVADVLEAGCGTAISRAPLMHRPVSAVCPSERAPKTPDPVSACPDGGASPMLICDCTSDSDCTEGTNGRCGRWIPPPVLACSYDECFQDSDCEGGALCGCRPSSSSSAPNVCVKGGNCTVDSDCGPGGYCSPSVLDGLCTCPSEELCGDAGGGCYRGSSSAEGSPPGPGWTPVPCVCGDRCGHGYFCHTGCDLCIDDSDCASGSCSYDVNRQRWECATVLCASIP